jgi:hypothetical protein
MLATSNGCTRLEPEAIKTAEYLSSIEYDTVYFVLHRFPQKEYDEPLFTIDGKPNPKVIQTSKEITYEVDLDMVKNLLNNPENFCGGLIECNLNLYSLVFYKNNSAIMLITPNLAGGDLGIRPFAYGNDFAFSWSEKGLGNFSTICHLKLELIGRSGKNFNQMPPPAGKDSPVLINAEDEDDDDQSEE